MDCYLKVKGSEMLDEEESDMLHGDELDEILDSVQKALHSAVILSQSYSNLDYDCKEAIVKYLRCAIDYVNQAQEKRSQYDDEYDEQLLRDVDNI
jgi:hypothetical protein